MCSHKPGRRIEKTAYGWNDRVVTKVARIILKRFANMAEWEKYWQEKFGDNSQCRHLAQASERFIARFRALTLENTGKQQLIEDTL